MAEIEFHDELIDDICRCAYLVASGDGEFTEEQETSLGEVRGYCRKFIYARKAIEYLEETNDIKKVRTMFDPDTPIMHNEKSFFYTYLHETQEALSSVKDHDGFLALVDGCAAKITDRYLQLLTILAAEQVTRADIDFTFFEREIFNRLFTSWEITSQEYEYWFAKYASTVVYGHFFDQDLSLEDYESEDEEDDITGLLAELFGVDSMEESEENQVETDDLPEIFQAIVQDDADLLLKTLEAGADANHTADISGIRQLSPLMLTAERSSLEMVTLLIEHGADVNAACEPASTPLIWALQGGNEDIAEYLIAAGAHIEPFAEGEADWSPLSMAASHHLVGVSIILLARGANPDWRDLKGMVPLKHACNAAQTDEAIELIDLLLKNGANPNLHDDEGFYPIHNAIDQGSARITKLLLCNGVPVDLCFPDTSEEFGSLLKRACMRANPEIIKQILDRLPDEQNTENKAPPFVMLQDDGTPALDDTDGFELVATVLMYGYKNEIDLWDIEESVGLLSEYGIKPDLTGLCCAFLFPDVAETIIPYCKDELNGLLQKHPELPLGYVTGLLTAGGDGIKYFPGVEDLWFHAVKAMRACGIDVPEEVHWMRNSGLAGTKI